MTKPDKINLGGLTKAQRARYHKILAGRLNLHRDGPMRIDNSIRAEALEIVLLESVLDGACCASCKAQAERGPQFKAPAVKLVAWEGRKLSADELRERMRALRVADSQKSPIAIPEKDSLACREAETGLPEAAALTDVSQMVKSPTGQFCAI